MFPSDRQNEASTHLVEVCRELVAERRLIIVSNRGPVEYRVGKEDNLYLIRSGGVLNSLCGISRHTELTWIASAMGETDHRVAADHVGRFQAPLAGHNLYLRFLSLPRHVYHKYYNLFCNPMLWFLQHYMWNSPYSPNVDAKVYDAWENGYMPANRAFAEAVIDEATNDSTPPFVMIHDYHLYLVGGYIRQQVPHAIMQHFIQVPWPAPGYWYLFPETMRRAILQSLCCVDIVGFQTRRDAHNFLHCCEAFLDQAEVDYVNLNATVAGRKTRATAYPVSVDVGALARLVRSPKVRTYEEQLKPHFGEQTIVRVDRAEPSKNVIRGLKAFDVLLERHPDLRGRVKLVCFLVPSRSGIKQYQRYTQETLDTVQAINAKYASEAWQPIKLFFENNYAQAIAGMRLCDVLLVNPVMDGMNLVAKEGPVVSANNAVLVLSESAGAHDQLRAHVISVSPADVEGTSQALYEALTMEPDERRRRAEALKKAICEEDNIRWLSRQFEDLRKLIFQLPLLLAV